MLETGLWQELSQKQLTLDQTSTPLQIDRSEVEQFYAPLALELIKSGQHGGRLIVAVAGPPGSGKTAFATLLAAVINVQRRSEQAVVIQQDGWHYTNEYLDSHTLDHTGENIPLRKIKGAPETYDTQAAYAFLNSIQKGAVLSYPVYSRQLHNPIPQGGVIGPHHQWIILEGNYWLLEETSWLPFQALFDITIFLQADPQQLLEGLRQRHLRGGKTPEFTQEHMDRVDIPNIERVLNHSSPAQIIVEKKNSFQITSIQRHK